MAAYAGKDSSFYSTTGGKPVEGAWYSGRRYMGGQLLAPGEYESGKQTSQEVIKQTNPANVSYIQQQQSQVNAQDLQAPVSFNLPSNQQTSTSSLQADVQAARTTLTTTLATQKAEADKKMEDAKVQQKEILGKVEPLTQPFRADMETAERERLHVNENFEANQQLVNELDQLLTEGNNLIKQQQEVTGLAAIRNPRIQQTMSDVQARAGVISAVINARNGQISVAENMIDRSINAIAADRQDQLSYYQIILNLNNQEIIRLDDASKKIAAEQVALLVQDEARAYETVKKIKDLLIDPATAQLMGQAGVTLNDSVEQINSKIANVQYANEISAISNKMELGGAVAIINPKSVPADQLVIQTDSKGVEHYYKAQLGTYGTTKPTKPTGTSVADRKEANRQSELKLATQFIQAHPGASAEELAAAIRADSSLSTADIAIALQGAGVKGYKPEELDTIAFNIIDQASSQYGGTEEGKQAALSAVDAKSGLSNQQKADVKQVIKDEYPIANIFQKTTGAVGNFFSNIFK